jgi:putative transposase
MPLQGNLSIERMCELARVSRASFYRSFHKQQPVAEELEVRSAIAIEHRRRYGYRRIPAELRRRTQSPRTVASFLSSCSLK